MSAGPAASDPVDADPADADPADPGPPDAHAEDAGSAEGGPASEEPTEGPEATVVIPAVDDGPVATPPADSRSATSEPVGAEESPPVPAQADPAPADPAPAPDAGDTIEFRRDLGTFSRPAAEAGTAGAGTAGAAGTGIAGTGTAEAVAPRPGASDAVSSQAVDPEADPVEPAGSTAPIGPPIGPPVGTTTPLTGPAVTGPDPAAPAGAPDPAGSPTPVGPPRGEPTAERGDADGSPPTGSDAGPGDPSGSGRSWWRRRAVLVPAAAVLGLSALYGLDLAVSSGDVPRGTVVAGLDLGGLSPAAASERLTEDLAPRMTADHPLVADDVQAVLHPPAAGIALDVPATVDAVDDQPLNPWTRLTTVFSDRTVDPVVTEDETALAAQLEQLAAQVDRAPVDATIAIDGTDAQVVEPVAGRTLDRDGAAAEITEALAAGGDPATPIVLPVEVAEVRVDAAEAQRVLDETVTPGLSAPVTVRGADGADSVEIPVEAIAAALTFEPQDDGTLATAVDPAALQAEMGDAFEPFGSPAQDARFEVSGDSISVIPSVDGQGIDPAVLAEQLLPVLAEEAPRSVTATLGPVPATFTTEQAEALGIREEVSSFTTNFTNAASGTNIRVAAEKVDGAIVRPGETFSLNTATGPRGAAQGYVPAGVISNGTFTTGIGGGVSQFATTMFNAVFFAGLEDVYHKPHSYYISRYPAGREATVYEGAIDLQWRNDTETGIYVQTEWVPGALTVRFWGTKYYDVESISSERYAVTQPVVQEKVDDGSCSPQGGSTGFGITVTRVFKDAATGAEVRREDFRTRYAAEPVIRCVPPPPPAEGAPDAAPATPTG
ncbi:VanW family protein [Modestobacter sp. URMC 112]